MADRAGQNDADARIESHLDAIDRTLAARGVPLNERRSITDDVETQIRDMLAAGGDVEGIFAKLDPPESYAEDAPGSAPVTPSVETPRDARLSRTAVVGAVWAPFLVLLLGGLPFVCFGVSGKGGFDPAPSPLELLMRYVIIPLGLTAPLGATLLGWIALAQIRRSAGRLWGLGLALFDGLFFPLLALDALIILAWCTGSAALSLAMWIGIPPAVACSAAADWLIARWAWRRVSTTS